jgi:hypothetical protein
MTKTPLPVSTGQRGFLQVFQATTGKNLPLRP